MSSLRCPSFLALVLLAVPAVSWTQDAPQTQTPIPVSDARDRVYYPGDTESVIPLGRKLFSNVLLDQKDIWTSPFHMHKRDAKWWIIFGAATAALMATDHTTSKLLENSRGQVQWANHISNVGSVYALIPFDVGFYAWGAWKDDAKARGTAVLGGEAMLDSLIVVEVFKYTVRRNRPNAGTEPGNFFENGASFPSGHAIASWSLASVIAHEYGGHSKLAPILAYGLAGLVSCARFAAQQHYASDIVAGAAMGWFIGRFVVQTHENHGLHQHGWLHPQIQPQLSPSTGTYAVSLAFVN